MSLFTRRIRGVSLVNLWGLGVLLVLVIALYLVKTFGAGERADIASTETQIAEEQRRIAVLKAEVAFLERPDRIQRLAEQGLNEQPISGRHDATVADLEKIARVSAASPPASSPPASAAPASDSPVSPSPGGPR
jgi:hypothetical protein